LDQLNNKHIPQCYKVNSRKNRLALLAGIIDSDGYQHDNCYEIVQKSKELAEDIEYLALSLGFMATVTQVEKGYMYNGEMRMGNYYRISIFGEGLETIPVVLERKKCHLRIITKRANCLRFQVESLGEGDYNGFELDGNRRFLLGDFTVTHNSTYVDTIRTHCENSKRIVHCVNLDPAAEVFNYPVAVDIRELITVDEIMDELPYGPNGGLVYAIEYLANNMEWFEEQLGDYDDDYLLIDCPGQIELYSHLDAMQTFVSTLQRWGYKVCGIYLIDSTFLVDSAKFISGALMALSAMVRFEMPHINVLTKMDLMHGKAASEDDLEKFTNINIPALIEDINSNTSERFQKLNEAIGSLLDDYSMVQFVPLNNQDEESINNLLLQVDNAIQYGEDLEVKENRDDEMNEEEEKEMNYPDFDDTDD